MLVVGDLLEDSQFPAIERDILEDVKYAFLWAIRDANRMCDSEILWVFMEMNFRMGIDCKAQL